MDGRLEISPAEPQINSESDVMGAWRSRRLSLKLIPGQSSGRMYPAVIANGDGRNGAESGSTSKDRQGGHPKIGFAAMEDCAFALAP